MITELNLKRVCNLELGDVFNHCCSVWRVTDFSNTEIIFQKVDWRGHLVDKPYYFGKNSRQYIDFIKNDYSEKWSRKAKPTQ